MTTVFADTTSACLFGKSLIILSQSRIFHGTDWVIIIPAVDRAGRAWGLVISSQVKHANTNGTTVTTSCPAQWIIRMVIQMYWEMGRGKMVLVPYLESLRPCKNQNYLFMWKSYFEGLDSPLPGSVLFRTWFPVLSFPIWQTQEWHLCLSVHDKGTWFQSLSPLIMQLCLSLPQLFMIHQDWTSICTPTTF